MKLQDIVDVKIIQNIQDQFSDATGLAAITVDVEGNYVTKGSNFTDFCMKYTRGTEKGLTRCVQCDNEGTGTYFCHAGLMDFSVDIILNGEKVGAMIGGQVLPEEPDLEKFKKIAKELGINEKEYINAVKKVPVRGEKNIRAAAEFLKLIVNQVINLEYFKNKNHKKIDTFDTEIKDCFNAIKEVKNKTKDLQGIASKENILSLNASIEASRVGQAGAGFAVVAKEIGELSKRSSHVYNEIQELVAGIEKSVYHMSKIE